MKEFYKKWFSKEGLLKIVKSFVWVALLVILVDTVTKWVVQNSLVYEGNSVTLIKDFLRITLVHNAGASFGMGSNGAIGWRIFWIAISVLLTGAIIFVYVKYFKKFSAVQKVALTLMIGGAFSNMIDRAFYWKATVGFDAVIDWIDFQFWSIDFAIFNLADAALVIGVLILIIVEIIDLIKEVRAKDKRGEYDIAPNVKKVEENKENADDKN